MNLYVVSLLSAVALGFRADVQYQRVDAIDPAERRKMVESFGKFKVPQPAQHWLLGSSEAMVQTASFAGSFPSFRLLADSWFGSVRLDRQTGTFFLKNGFLQAA